jgi:hypothetical protein
MHLRIIIHTVIYTALQLVWIYHGCHLCVVIVEAHLLGFVDLQPYHIESTLVSSSPSNPPMLGGLSNVTLCFCISVYWEL